MSVLTFRAETEQDTIHTGAQLVAVLPRRAVVLLTGDLGAGKTTLAKGIVQALGEGSADDVSSPTFTLIHEHGRVYHIDLYRLETEREVEGLGLEELFDRDAIVLIEWGERFPRLMPADAIQVRLTISDGVREIVCSGLPTPAQNPKRERRDNSE